MLHCIAYYLVLMQAKFTTLTQVTASRLMPRTSSRSKTSRNLTLHTQDVLLKCESLRLHLVDLLDLRPRQHFYCFDRSDHGAFDYDFAAFTFIFSHCLSENLSDFLARQRCICGHSHELQKYSDREGQALQQIRRKSWSHNCWFQADP